MDENRSTFDPFSSELRVDVYRNALPYGAPGADHCAVRVTHMPTGTVETRSVPEDAASQMQCRDLAVAAIALRIHVMLLWIYG